MGLCYVLSSAKAYQDAGHELIYAGSLPKRWQAFAKSELSSRIPQSLLIDGKVIDALHTLEQSSNDLLATVDQVYVFGDGEALSAVNAYRNLNNDRFKVDVKWIASVYGPMQCMLKGVCAQCLQWQIDPETGQRTKAVYACSWHHQPMDIIDLEHLDERSAHHRMQHTLTTQWLRSQLI